MKKKLFLLLTFGLFFICFSNITKAMVYDSSKSYSCNVSGYDIVYNDSKTSVYCCPSGYEAHSEGCYLPMSGAAQAVRQKCKDKGAKYKNSGTKKYCYVDFKDPVISSNSIDDDDNNSGNESNENTNSGVVTYEYGKEYHCVEKTYVLIKDSTRKEAYCCPGEFKGNDGKCFIKAADFSGFYRFPSECYDFGKINGDYCYVDPTAPIVEELSCDKLLGDEVIDFINEIMGWVRIAAPILLIGFGVLDFVKATFSGKEEDMKKNRERFIKRIVAAILLFLVPIFVNLLLELINKVWSWVNPDTCIK